MEDDFSTVIIASLVGLIAYLWWSYHAANKHVNLPPGPRAIPIIGHWVVTKHDARKLNELSKTYGGIYSLQSFGVNFVVLNDWENVKAALLGQSDVFSGRPPLYINNYLTKDMDIVGIDGPRMRERKTLAIKLLRNQGFDKSTMEGVIYEEVLKIFDFVDKFNGKPIQVKDMFFMPIINILSGILLNQTYRYDDHEMKQMSHILDSIFKLFWKALPVSMMPLLRFVPFDPFGYLEMIRVYNKFAHYIEDQVEEHLRTFVDGNEPRDFIDAYLSEIGKRKDTLEDSKLDKRHPYQKDCLVQILLNLFMAGAETSISTLEWSLLYMALWQDKQQKVQQELDSVIGKNRLPNYADAAWLPYTEATILEVHRFASVLPLAIPHRVMTTTKLAGYTILKDTIVTPNIWSVHHDKTTWTDPEVFRPERFINSTGKVEKPEYLIPFLIGGRTCLGTALARMQLFLIFSSLLGRYTFSFVSGDPLPDTLPLTNMSLTACTKPFRLIMKPR